VEDRVEAGAAGAAADLAGAAVYSRGSSGRQLVMRPALPHRVGEAEAAAGAEAATGEAAVAGAASAAAETQAEAVPEETGDAVNS
jgi:hypothetical protein